MGSSGQDSVWAGTVWSFLSVSLCTSAAQLDRMWVQFRMGQKDLTFTATVLAQ